MLRRFECSDAVKTVLTTDASCYGLGAVLTQTSGGEEKIIAFVSRTLSDAEKNYSVIEKEMLACFWATKRLRSFIWGMNYTLRTDHKPLTTKGSAFERTSHRINRWSSRMLEYNFNVEYVQGINNVVADCLSRLPLKAQPEEYSHDMPDDECIAQIQAATRGVISQSELTTATRNDTNIQIAMKYMTSKWPQRNKLPGNLLTLYDVADEQSIKDTQRRENRHTRRTTITCDTTGPRRTLRHDTGQEKTSRVLLMASNGQTRRRYSPQLSILCEQLQKLHLSHYTAAASAVT